MPSPADSNDDIERAPRSKERAFEQLMSGYVRLFLETRNPIYAWQLYRDARAAGVRVPSVVLEYFDECAKNLLGPGGTDSAKVIAENIGIGAHRGKLNAAEEAKQRDRNVRILRDIFRRQREKNPELDINIFGAVGEAFDLEPASVQAIYYSLTQPKVRSELETEHSEAVEAAGDLLTRLGRRASTDGRNELNDRERAMLEEALSKVRALNKRVQDTHRATGAPSTDPRPPERKPR